MPEIRKMFRMDDKFVTVANRIVESAIMNINATVKHVNPDPILVGVHVRRDDYKTHLLGYKASVSSKSYFDKAMQFFRDIYKKQGGQKSILFLLVSDDEVIAILKYFALNIC